MVQKDNPWVFTQRLQVNISQTCLHINVYCCTFFFFTIAKFWNQSKYLPVEGMDKANIDPMEQSPVVCIKWTQLEIIILIKSSDSQKHRCHIFSLICGSYVLCRCIKSCVYLWHENRKKTVRTEGPNRREASFLGGGGTCL